MVWRAVLSLKSLTPSFIPNPLPSSFFQPSGKDPFSSSCGAEIMVWRAVLRVRPPPPRFSNSFSNPLSVLFSQWKFFWIVGQDLSYFLFRQIFFTAKWRHTLSRTVFYIPFVPVISTELWVRCHLLLLLESVFSSSAWINFWTQSIKWLSSLSKWLLRSLIEGFSVNYGYLPLKVIYGLLVETTHQLWKIYIKIW